MIITNITLLQKKKVLVELDEHLQLPLYESELKKYNLVQGKEVDTDTLSLVMQEILPKRAKLRAMHLLVKRSYTEYGLREKLKSSRYPDSLIEEAIEYVKSFGYINDMKYVADYIHTYMEHKSKKKIIQELYLKGITKELFEEVWEEMNQESTIDIEREQIYKFLEKKNFNYHEASLKEQQKMVQALFRKGYSIDLIKRCIHMEDIF